MPFKRDPRGGGTNADGSKSALYCSYCYEGGRFTAPEMTARQMQDAVKRKLKEADFPGFLAALLTRKIPNLQRWRKS